MERKRMGGCVLPFLESAREVTEKLAFRSTTLGRLPCRGPVTAGFESLPLLHRGPPRGARMYR